MKKLLLILFVFAAFGFLEKSEARYRGGSYAVDFFYHDLAPYGEWIEIDYDVFVWRPTRVHYDWQPYSIGRWVWSSNGWYWDSYEPFGWATYHYGRWFYDDYYGWVWAPDTQWGPSWVEWRYNNDYIGWAPLPPYAEFRTNVGIHFSITWRSNPVHWHFVRYDHFHHYNVHKYFAAPKYKYNIFNKTKYRTNYYDRGGRVFNGGVGRSYVEKRGGKKLKTYDLRDSRSKIRNYKSRDNNSDRIEVYRPEEKVIRNAREIERNTITRGSKKSSLKTDKIAINRNRNDEDKGRNYKREVDKKRDERSKERIDRNSREDSTYRGKADTRKREEQQRFNYDDRGDREKRDYSKNSRSGEKVEKQKTGYERSSSQRDNYSNRYEKKEAYKRESAKQNDSYRGSTSQMKEKKSYPKPKSRSENRRTYERKTQSSAKSSPSYSKSESKRKESSSGSYKKSSERNEKSRSSSSGNSKERVRSRR